MMTEKNEGREGPDMESGICYSFTEGLGKLDSFESIRAQSCDGRRTTIDAMQMKIKMGGMCFTLPSCLDRRIGYHNYVATSN
jgi:hypothetical protein